MKRKLLLLSGVGLIVLLVSGVMVGAALAGEPEEGKEGAQQTFISKMARILGIQEQQLRDAAKQAGAEMVDEAVTAGKMAPEQADRLKERIEKSGALWGPPAIQLPKGRLLSPPLHAFNHFKDLADFLGMNPAEVIADLKAGKTPATIATEHGKTPAELKDAILDRLQKHLDEAVAGGRLTQEKADEMMQKAGEQIDQFLNASIDDLKGLPKMMPKFMPRLGGHGHG